MRVNAQIGHRRANLAHHVQTLGKATDLELSGRKILVSGGSRGIGRAIVQAFIAEGAQVAFCARGETGLANEQAGFGPAAYGSSVDIADPDAVTSRVESSADCLGGIDIVIPNVGALAGGADLETWRRAFEIDVLGSVAMVSASLPFLTRSGSGSVVLISSVSGREVDMFAEPYCVMKSALIHYGKTLSAKLAPHRFRGCVFERGEVSPHGHKAPVELR